MGKAAEFWDRLSQVYATADTSDIPDLYAHDAIYLEPYNPPHRGNLLIQAYLKDWIRGKDEVVVEAKRVIEGPDDTELAVEWTISYTAAGRRWNELPRASFFAFDEDGRVAHHRDYT